MTSYQYRKSHYGDKTILRPSYLHNGISYTGKTTSLYWIRAQVSVIHEEVFQATVTLPCRKTICDAKTVYTHVYFENTCIIHHVITASHCPVNGLAPLCWLASLCCKASVLFPPALVFFIVFFFAFISHHWLEVPNMQVINWYQGSFLPTRFSFNLSCISNYIHCNVMLDKITCPLQPLKFGKRWVISSHTGLLGMWLIIHSGI